MHSKNGHHNVPLASIFSDEGGTVGAYVRLVDGGLIALGTFGAPLMKAPLRWLVRSLGWIALLDLLATAYAGTSPVAGALAGLGLEAGTNKSSAAGVAGAGMQHTGTIEERAS